MSEMSAMNRKLKQTVAETISKQVEHFNKTEIECLIREFTVLLGEPAAPRRAVTGLDRAKFRSILHNVFGMTDDMIMDGDCFHVYDLNGDNYISREEMFHMLKNSLIRQPTEEDPDEGIKDLVEITLKKMDHDHDGRLSFGDFEKAVREENLLLEAFGTCLPDTTVIPNYRVDEKCNTFILEHLNLTFCFSSFSEY
ncbi:EF-hand calcium-binding domain-containing protein 1 isoform X3 [Seriola lalandi dorsalis]|uniref:EF-hand calcium-binding domain-containing protein 1 isoform X3 n=1 Tax=Seriola lalandi dorsalis TaxID=1841481 RepID=UPI000C6F9125|nr:EF-hand calcium-binding domain-containing protein 1 isoform X3 [Seriola lalandi dorsalis]